MKTCYINSAVSITTQDTFDVEKLVFKPLDYSNSTVKAKYPEFKKFISPIALRRMSSAVKMGVTASQLAMSKAEIEVPDAILTGTGMGCIDATESFLEAIIANNEDYLTPTAFIQSTHNTVGAQIALGLKCKSYNNTYVNGAVSFESALLDAKLCIELDEDNSILVGGIDEIGTIFSDLQYKNELKYDSGIHLPKSEGAHFFGLSNIKKENSICLKSVEVLHHLKMDSIETHAFSILKKCGLDEVDAIITGHKNDEFDVYYESLLENTFQNTTQIRYKDVVGDYFTVSGFALFLAQYMLINQTIPEGLTVKQNKVKPFKTILIYNQEQGQNHSFILISTC